MQFPGIVALCAAGWMRGVATGGRHAPGHQYAGQNVDALVINFGPPASTFKIAGHVLHLAAGNQTNIVTDRGSEIASTQFCRVSVIAPPKGVVSQLNTENSSAGGGVAGALGMYGSICGEPTWDGTAKLKTSRRKTGKKTS